MTTEVQPLPKKVTDAVRRHKSPGRHVGFVMGTLFHLVMFLSVLGGIGAGGWFLWKKALFDPRFLLDGATLGMGGAVRQCPESVDELSAIGRRFDGRSLLDPALVGDLAGAYGESFWVKRVSRLRRSFPNRVDVELQLRMPVAQVKEGGRYWLVDMDGVLLPVEGGAKPFLKLPEIVGVTAGTMSGRPQVGEQWTDEGVVGGLGVMRAFWASPLSGVLPVSRVVVNTGVFKADGGVGRELRRRFEVVTESGAVVRWGTYTDLADGGGELTSVEKMWNLQELLAAEEALHSGVCFDVRTRLPGFSLVGAE